MTQGGGLNPDATRWADVDAIRGRIDLGPTPDASDEVVAETRIAMPSGANTSRGTKPLLMRMK